MGAREGAAAVGRSVMKNLDGGEARASEKENRWHSLELWMSRRKRGQNSGQNNVWRAAQRSEQYPVLWSANRRRVNHEFHSKEVRSMVLGSARASCSAKIAALRSRCWARSGILPHKRIRAAKSSDSA